MAVGNAIVQTAKFNPLTISEWGAPLKEYATQHAASEETLNKLDSEAKVYEAYINQNPESDVAKRYQEYINSIDDISTLLATQGVTPQMRTDLLSLRNLYNSSILPTKTAVNTYQTIMENRYKDQSKGIIGAPDVSIGYLLDHPEYNINQDRKSYILGSDVSNTTTKIFKGLTGFDRTPQYKSSPDGSYTAITTPQSYSEEDVYTAITGEGDGNPNDELLRAVNNIRKQFGYDELNDDDKKIVDSYMLSGAVPTLKPAKVEYRNTPEGKTSVGGKIVGSMPNLGKDYTGIGWLDGYDDTIAIYKNKTGTYHFWNKKTSILDPNPITGRIIINGKQYVPKETGPTSGFRDATDIDTEKYVGIISMEGGISYKQVDDIPKKATEIHLSDLNHKMYGANVPQVKNAVANMLNAFDKSLKLKPSDIQGKHMTIYYSESEKKVYVRINNTKYVPLSVPSNDLLNGSTTEKSEKASTATGEVNVEVPGATNSEGL